MRNNILKEDLSYIVSRVRGSLHWEGADILVTGCGGFLGFYFLNLFCRHGRELGINKVVGVDSFILGKPKWLELLERSSTNLLEVIHADISSEQFTEQLSGRKLRYIIHGASIASPTFYRKYPIETVNANVWGLRNLFDYARSLETLSGFLFFSSSEIYGDPSPDCIPTPEEYRGNVSCHGPRACYDEAKRFCETLCWIYSSQYSMPITVARPFNNFGPGLSIADRRLPADFARSVLEKRSLVIHSDGLPTRTFCYAADAIVGYLLCLGHGKYDYFNIGSDQNEISVIGFARLFSKIGEELTGYAAPIEMVPSSDKDYLTHNPTRRRPNIDKARTILGYLPSVGLEEGIGRYLKHLQIESAL